ncbi:beta-galactoside alpha-2,6-sialyltransferase 2 [Battus philenor]|uniref:beta-galactoside alpha-2,6-sialyltransferase 2 n=1 Tax=Battus philenor TaxID=42288 RepID=UPI0035CFCE5C
MKAAAMSVWVFINLLCFGMCGYLYLIWSQYWMNIERQRLFNKTPVSPQRVNNGQDITYQENFYSEKYNTNSVYTKSISKDQSGHMNKRSVVSMKNSGKLYQSPGTQARPSTNIVRKSNGSPRFPNIHKPILEFDSDKYACNDYLTTDCEIRTAEFKTLLLKEFHRVLMSDSKVFTSGLNSQNTYDVQYERGQWKETTKRDIECALSGISVKTVTANDEPFKRLNYPIPTEPLLGHRTFNTCAVVTSAGSLLGSHLGDFIDSHDMVLRFNNAPTDNYTEDVGSKTTFRILNSQVVTKPEFNFLNDPLYKEVSILIWDPANYTATLDEWFHHSDFPLFPVYKRLLEIMPGADVHLLHPKVLWSLWTLLQDSSPYRLKRNPPSSGFIGIWFAMHRCNRVRVFEYVPSTRATRRCHYHAPRADTACTLGAWHPLAQEKALVERIRENSDLDVFQRGFVDIAGVRSLNCQN